MHFMFFDSDPPMLPNLSLFRKQTSAVLLGKKLAVGKVPAGHEQETPGKDDGPGPDVHRMLGICL
jgi:hypothetical protein